MTLNPQDENDLSARLSRLEAGLKVQSDRAAIADCTVRFCRAINRRDPALLRSVFHPDAIDDHGFFVGGREDFLKWVDSVYDALSFTQHYVTNQTIELSGPEAHVETYWFLINVKHEDKAVILRGGRYIDRFEERDGVWAISARICLMEWNGLTLPQGFSPEVQALLLQSGVPTQDKNDPSYQRPLRIRRKPFILKPDPGN